ncbi:MAG: YeeE/YedE family protein [Bacteroidetes bacterium]|nr:MAG: YeeE/YedE family protein [Bacteroidota bacterium]
MESFIEFISQPWHWSVSGVMIVVVMALLLWFGGEFGVSGNLRTMCSIIGGGKHCDFFDFNWRDQVWNLVFVGGAVIGGFIASNYLASPEPVQISAQTAAYLETVGIHTPQTMEEGAGFVPDEIFALENAFSLKNLIILIVGGFLIGFGTRWAGGCTSGHAISGLSNLQLPSLIAVIGFFIGGLTMAWLILPHILRM